MPNLVATYAPTTLTPEEEAALLAQLEAEAAAVPPPADGYTGGGTYNPYADPAYVPPPAEVAPAPAPVVYEAAPASPSMAGPAPAEPVSPAYSDPNIVTTTYPAATTEGTRNPDYPADVRAVDGSYDTAIAPPPGTPTPYLPADPSLVDTRSLTERVAQETPFRGVEQAPYVAPPAPFRGIEQAPYVPPPPPPTFRPFDDGLSPAANMNRLALERKRNQSTQPETFRGIEQAHGGTLGPPTPTLDFLLPLRRFVDEGGDVEPARRMIATYLGLDPDDPNLDYANQISRNLYDLGGDVAADLLRAAGGLAQREGRGAQLLLGDPLLRAGEVKDWLWHAAEDVFGPHGMGLRQIQSTANPWGTALAENVRDPLGDAKDDLTAGGREWWQDHPGVWFDKTFWDADAAYRKADAAARQVAGEAGATRRTTLDAGRETATNLANAVGGLVDRIPTPDTAAVQDALASGRALQGRAAGAALANRLDPGALADLARAGLQGLRTMDLPSLEMPTSGTPADTPIPTPSRPDVSGLLTGAQDTANAAAQRARGALLVGMLRDDPRAQAVLSVLQAAQGIDLPDTPDPGAVMGNIPDVSALPAFLQEAVQRAGIGGETPRSAFLPGAEGRSASRRPPQGGFDVPDIPDPGSVDLPDLRQTAENSIKFLQGNVADPIAARLAGGGRGGQELTTETPATVPLPGPAIEDASSPRAATLRGMTSAEIEAEFRKNMDGIIWDTSDGVPIAYGPGGRRYGTPLGFIDPATQAFTGAGTDMSLEDFWAQVRAAGGGTAAPTEAAPVSDAATSSPVSSTGVTLEDASVPAPAETDTGSARSSDRGSYDRPYNRRYDNYDSGDDFNRGYQREFAARPSKRRRRGKRSIVGGGFGGDMGGFWDGFPFNRPPSDIRNLVLAAIQESLANGGRDRRGVTR